MRITSMPLTAGLCLGMSLLLSVATAAAAEVESGVDLTVQSVHQTLPRGSADVSEVTVSPHFQVSNWDVSLDVPWVSADSNYINTNYPSRLVTACENAGATVASRYPNLSPRALARLTGKLDTYCQSQGVTNNSKVDGISDVTAFVRYGMMMDTAGVWMLSFGAGHKFDNGDVEQGLGSGTQETLLEAALGANTGTIYGTVSIGSAFVSGGDEFTESSYQYASLDMGVMPLAWLTLGANYGYTQSDYVLVDDVYQLTGYAKFRLMDNLSVKLFARDFGGAEGYPEREYGGALGLFY